MTDVTDECTAPLNKDVRKWAMLCHLSALVGLLGNGIGFLVGPLLVWLFKKDDHPFINENGKEVVNFQITMLIAVLISIPLVFVFVGFFLIMIISMIIFIMMIVFPIIAGIKAGNEEHYRYPLTFRFIK